MKLIITIVSTNLVTNFCPLFVLSHKPKTRVRFSPSWWSGNGKYFLVTRNSFLFIAGHPLLQSHGKFIRLFLFVL